jgi:hypothetical protein
LLEGGVQLGVPCSWRLPQAVEGLAQAENLVLLVGDDESGRLVDVDLLLQVTVEEGGLDVHVVHTPSLLGCQREEETNGLHPCDGRECVVEVDSLLLDKPTTNQTHLVLDHRPGLILLELVDPLKGDGAVADRKIRQHPCPVPLDRIHLLLHRGAPCRVSLRLSEGARLAVLMRQVQLCLEVVHRHLRDRLIAEDVVHGAVP